jgi:hypothetical protein
MTTQTATSGTGSVRRCAARLARAAIAVLALGASPGCGDDEGTATPPPQAARPPAAANTAPGAKGQLAEKLHVEDRVGCPVPERPSDPVNGKCDPKAPSCGEHLYCLALAQGNFCEPCPERDGIRHAFKERDFAVEHNRDPFQSFLLPQLQVGRTSDAVPLDPTKKCLREDQMVATTYSYSDLKLVAIIAQGTQRKVLMMGGPLGYIIKPKDCVGKEKAVVKDIGTGYVTFQVNPDPSVVNQRAPEEYSVQLNPKQLALSDPELPSQAPRTTISPAVPPAATLPPAALPARPQQLVPGATSPDAARPGAASPSAAGSAASTGPGAPGAATPGTAAVPAVTPPVELPSTAPKRLYVPADTGAAAPRR